MLVSKQFVSAVLCDWHEVLCQKCTNILELFDSCILKVQDRASRFLWDVVVRLLPEHHARPYSSAFGRNEEWL